MADIGKRKGDSDLILSLARGKTVREAAESAGIGERTAHRRLSEPVFLRLVQETRAEMMTRAMGKLADASIEAVETLVSLLKAESETVRLGAARTILEAGPRLRELTDMETRLADLERRFEEPETGSNVKRRAG